MQSNNQRNTKGLVVSRNRCARAASMSWRRGRLSLDLTGVCLKVAYSGSRAVRSRAKRIDQQDACLPLLLVPPEIASANGCSIQSSISRFTFSSNALLIIQNLTRARANIPSTPLKISMRLVPNSSYVQSSASAPTIVLSHNQWRQCNV